LEAIRSSGFAKENGVVMFRPHAKAVFMSMRMRVSSLILAGLAISLSGCAGENGSPQGKRSINKKLLRRAAEKIGGASLIAWFTSSSGRYTFVHVQVIPLSFARVLSRCDRLLRRQWT
jgi:hypothetical protein